MTNLPTQPELSFWEKLDLIPGYISVISSVLYAAATGVFRDKSGAKQYNVHVFHALVRKMCSRMTARQTQYVNPPSSAAYEEFMKEKNLPSETVTLPHGTVGHWFGKKDAKNVLVYYHGGGFVLAASTGHFNFINNLLKGLNSNGHDVAVFFLAYTLAPTAAYPTQLRQAVEALRYILSDSSRSPSSVLVGGDSAGGNLALGTLLHLSHPNPEIDPLPITEKLAGVCALAPWVSFRSDWPSLDQNRYKDIIPKEALTKWSDDYLNGRKGDAWSEPMLAPLDWWKDALVERVIFVAGKDEILLDAIDEFVTRFKTVFPNTTYVVGDDETHVAPVYSRAILGHETQQERDLKGWIAAKL